MNLNEQRRLEDRLRNQRPTLDPLTLDQIKQRALRTPRRGTSMKARLTTAMAVAALAVSTGGAVALIGPGNLVGNGENAAQTQYGTPGPPGANGNNGNNGANGANGQNGLNGTSGTTTVVTINIPVNAPLPGKATPTKTKHTRIRVCRRYAHRSVKFHHTFHPKVCFLRFV